MAHPNPLLEHKEWALEVVADAIGFLDSVYARWLGFALPTGA
jgi:hypothetical protein